MTHKLALLAAATSLTFAGAAIAQTTTSPTHPTGPMPPAHTTTPAQSLTPPVATPTDPAAPVQPGMSPAPAASPAGSAATPSSATVAPTFKAGMAVKDAQGVSVGQITGTSTGADGSTNVIVTHGGVKFALPGASLSATADGGVQTTATKAQIDATVAGARPQ